MIAVAEPAAHTAWVLTEERPVGEGTGLVLTAVGGRHPRIRHRIDPDGVLRAGVVVGPLDASLAGDEHLAGVEGERLPLLVPSARQVEPMPTADGAAAAERLQRGAGAVWEAVLHDVEVRGVFDLELDAATSVVLPLLRHTCRRIVVTDDGRLLVLDEHATQVRPAPGEAHGRDVGEAVVALWRRPAPVAGSRIRLFPTEAVRCSYVDGRWALTATGSEGRLQLALPLDFPAERFGDA
jgi:hypothetical protein